MVALLIWLGCYLLVEASGKNKDYKYCNGRGYRDAYGLCRCSGNYFGQACEYSESNLCLDLPLSPLDNLTLIL